MTDTALESEAEAARYTWNDDDLEVRTEDETTHDQRTDDPE